MTDNSGTLYLVATPIGNLGDMVPRALEVLQQVAWVAAEDTRHSARLLNHFGIDTPLMAYHDHSDERQRRRLIDRLLGGDDVALISDAGTPVIADPGFRLVRDARQAGIDVSAVPGPCAAVMALSLSGLPSNAFVFQGFPPHKTGARHKFLDALRRDPRTLIFYEAPHRVLATLQDMVQIFGAARPAALARELTKLHETVIDGSLADLAHQVADDPNHQRGEIVLLVAGSEDDTGADELEQQRVLAILLEELPVKRAAALAAKITGGKKNDLYQLALRLQKREP